MARTIARNVRGRKAPAVSATTFPIGKRMKGLDGSMWVVKRTTISRRWVRVASANPKPKPRANAKAKPRTKAGRSAGPPYKIREMRKLLLDEIDHRARGPPSEFKPSIRSHARWNNFTLTEAELMGLARWVSSRWPLV